MPEYRHEEMLIEGRMTLVPEAAVPAEDGDLPVGAVVFWLDEASDKLMVRVKYATGVMADGEVALTPES